MYVKNNSGVFVLLIINNMVVAHMDKKTGKDTLAAGKISNTGSGKD
jgi:hypothetical protein